MNTFGQIFKINIYGESHGAELGILIDGCPAGIPFNEHDFYSDLERRKTGLLGTSGRIEPDVPIIKSGVYNNFTSGSPIMIAFENQNTNSDDYQFEGFHRPGHADFVANRKFNNFNNPLGGGHFSGRLTLGIVAAGVIAKKILNKIKFSASVLSAGGKKDINNAIQNTIQNKDSIGGIVECAIDNVPIGLGEPFFYSIESAISHLAFAIPGVKAIEFGSGTGSSSMTGSEHNDIFIDSNGRTKTNNSGGINGGISNGNQIIFRLHIKPTSSIAKQQTSYNFNTNKPEVFEIKGRHDACIALRVPVIAESIAAIALADLFLLNKGLQNNHES